MLRRVGAKKQEKMGNAGRFLRFKPFKQPKIDQQINKITTESTCITSKNIKDNLQKKSQKTYHPTKIPPKWNWVKAGLLNRNFGAGAATLLAKLVEPPVGRSVLLQSFGSPKGSRWRPGGGVSLSTWLKKRVEKL